MMDMIGSKQHLVELIMEGLLHHSVLCAVITPWFPCPHDVISTRMNTHTVRCCTAFVDAQATHI